MTESTHSGTPDPSAQSATSGTLAQLQSRLLSLAGQLDTMQQQLHTLTTSTQQNSEQVASLTRNLTDPSAAEVLHEQLAELVTQMESGREVMAGVADSVAQLAAVDLGAALDNATSNAERALAKEMREQMDALAHMVAKQDQMERLIQMVASEERVSSLADEVQMLIRTQLKTNALLESKEAQVTGALHTLQEVATRREALQTGQSEASLQRLNEIRESSRAELAADLLPAIDGLEGVLESGQGMMERLVARREERRAQRRRVQAARQEQAAQAAAARRTGFFGRLRRGASPPEAQETVDLPFSPSAPEEGADRLDAQNIETVDSWLRAVKLVHDRFLGLLAAQSIEPIHAQDQPFDPHQHSAVDTEARDDVPPDTVLRVLRKGYRQKKRVLRYAEVVIARSSTAATADTQSDAQSGTPASTPPAETATAADVVDADAPGEAASNASHDEDEAS